MDDNECVMSAEAPLLGTATLPLARAGAASAGAGNESPLAEATRLASLGWPLIVEEVLAYGSTVIGVAVAGRLGAKCLSVFVLARSVTNITGVSLLNGATSAIETACSQAHGSGNAALLGEILQRSLLIMLLACLPLLALYMKIETMLLWLGQDVDLAHAAARYIALFSPTIVLTALRLCVFRYLISQGAVAYVLAASAMFCAVTLPINWLLVFWLGWGLDGSALAAVACELFLLVTLVVLAAAHNAHQPPDCRPWQGLSRSALAGWPHFLGLAAPSTAMLVLDWWLYDVVTLLAGRLLSPELALAATGILYNLQTCTFTVPFGLAFAVGYRIGSLLGAAAPAEAKRVAELGTALGIGSTALLALGLLAGRSLPFRLFTSDPEVIDLCCTLQAPLLIVVVSNGGSAVLSAVLRGCGRQKHGAWVNAGVNWVLGLPLQAWLAFKQGWGIAGLWWALAASSALQTLVLALLASRLGWQRETMRAARLVRRLSSVGS